MTCAASHDMRMIRSYITVCMDLAPEMQLAMSSSMSSPIILDSMIGTYVHNTSNDNNEGNNERRTAVCIILHRITNYAILLIMPVLLL